MVILMQNMLEADPLRGKGKKYPVRIIFLIGFYLF